MAQNQSLLSLAEGILEQTKDIVKDLQVNELQEPTFESDSSDIPHTPEYEALRSTLKTSIEDLQHLVDGPAYFLRTFCCIGYDLGALQVALDFDFFTLVPEDDDIHLEDLASKAGLDLDRVQRIVRQLITYRIFQDSRPGFVSHSSTSIVLRNDGEIRAFAHYTVDEMFKAASECNNNLKASPYETSNVCCPFATRHGVPTFEYYSQNPDKALRFAKAMAGLTKMNHNLDELKSSLQRLDLKGTMVDVGGGSGHISMALARLFPNLNFVVQDSQSMLAEGESRLTDDIRDRVSFSAHDFFKPQPYKNAAAFLLRQCTINWADREVVVMLKNLVPGLENSSPDTPLIINDIVLPEPGAWPRHRERVARQVDMVMLVSYGGKQRTKAEFETLLKEADPRYEIRGVYDDNPLGLLEVYLNRGKFA